MWALALLPFLTDCRFQSASFHSANFCWDHIHSAHSNLFAHCTVYNIHLLSPQVEHRHCCLSSLTVSRAAPVQCVWNSVSAGAPPFPLIFIQTIFAWLFSSPICNQKVFTQPQCVWNSVSAGAHASFPTPTHFHSAQFHSAHFHSACFHSAHFHSAYFHSAHFHSNYFHSAHFHSVYFH